MKKYKYRYKKKSNSLFSVLVLMALVLFFKKGGAAFTTENAKEFASWLMMFAVIVFILIAGSSIMLKQKKRSKYLNSGIDIVDKMDGFEFEHFLKYHFNNQGYKAVVTSESYDFGADLLVEKDNQKIVVQAKRYNSSVGIKAIQEVVGAVNHYKAAKGIVVTNNYFTKSAIELAVSNHVELWDRTVLIELMSNNSGRDIANTVAEETIKDGVCPSCNGKLILRSGTNGQFYGCSNFPKCKVTKSV